MESPTRGAARTATLVALPVALLTGVLVYWLLGGFTSRGTPHAAAPAPKATGPVQVPAPALAEPTASVCRALVAKLPDTVNGSSRRPVTAGGEQNAAYGDPPIVLSCGTARPTIPQDAQLFRLDNVCWWPEQRADGAVWTTVGREVPVRVTVPKANEGPSQWVIDFVPAIASAVPPDASASTNC